jgi:predicted Zn finger-like uncharacterized protein
MIITCEACNTSFNLDDKMLKPTGSKVRCSVCANVFTAFPAPAPAHEPPRPPVEPEPPAPPAQADALDDGGGDLLSDAPQPDDELKDEPEEAPDTEIEDAVSDALEGDLGLDLEPAPEAADDGDATIMASLDDDDLSLDSESDGADEDGTATVIASLDDDLDLTLDDPPEVAETVIADLDQEDFDLDLPSETDGDPEGNATVIANLDDETFDLDDDFSLEPADADEADATVASEAVVPESLDELDDLDLTLDMEDVDDAPPQATAVPETTADELDDLSLDFDLDADDEPAEASTGKDEADASDDGMELSLELDDAGSDADKAPVLDDDLDLSSLGDLLDDDDADEDDTATMAVEEADDLELSLDMENDLSVDDTDAGDATDEALEDLEFDLDGEGKSEDADLAEAADADQEIDLSEIEKMLEEPEQDSAKFSSVPEQDLDLDIEASLETEKWMSESGDDDQLVVDEELDLSELEQALDDIDMDAADDTPDDAELDLDIAEGDPLGTPTETVAVDSELDFDLSDFEDTPSPPSGADAAASESVDMELEFEVEEDDKVAQTLEDEGLEETVAIPEPTPAATEAAPSDAMAPADVDPGPKPVKKGVSKSLVFLLIIAILGGGGYGTYYLLNQNGIEIPFLSDYLKPKVNDPGNLKLTTYDINSKFIENANAGKLFVITGKVKNGYAENRGMVTLSGKIFSTGKVLANQERVYCGNIMSDLELANLELDKIKTRLTNRLGDNRSNVKIEPGQSIPFMVVFSDLPDDLEEFTIEVTGSTSLK